MKRVYGIRLIFCFALGFFLQNQSAAQALMESQFYSRREGIPYAKPTKIEKGPKGLIWVATEGEGLFVWNGRKAFSIPELHGRFVTDFDFSGDTALFIATDMGLFYHSLRTKKTDCRDSLIAFPFLLDIDSQSNIWIASLSEGLFRLDSKIPSTPIPAEVLDDFKISNDTFYFFSNNRYLTYSNKQWNEPLQLDANSKKSISRELTNLYRNSVDIASNTSCQALLFKDSIVLYKKQKQVLSYPLSTRNGKLLFTEEAIWIAGENGLHFIPFHAEVSEWLLEAKEEIHAIEEFGSTVWLASDKNLYSSANPKKIETSLVDIGYVFDLHYHENSELLYLASESGLHSWNGRNLTKVNLPGQDGFAFHIESQANKIWIAGGEALYLLSGEQLSTLTIAGVRDMRITKLGLLFISFSGELGIILNTNEIKLFDKPKEKNNWIGFVESDLGNWAVVSASSRFQWLDLENQKWLNSEIILEQTTPLIGLSQTKTGEFLFLYERFCIFQKWDARNGNTTLSLALGSDYLIDNPQDAQILLTSSYFLIASQSRLNSITWSSKNQYEIPPPLFSEVRTALSSSQSLNPLQYNETAFTLPYHSSFVRIQFGLDPDKDLFKWAFEYELIDSEGNSIEGSGYEQAVFPTLVPENYTFKLFTLDPRTGLRSEPTILKFQILPPIWQKPWFIFLIAALVTTFSILTIRRRLAKIREETRVERELNKLEGMALRLQMNPHFIFNALDSISSFIFKNEPKQAVRYLSSFARLIRATLESAHENLIPLRTEIDILKSYLELERLRTEERMEFEIHCEDELQESLMVPPLIIQPYVENAVKHGLKPIMGEGWVKVRFIEETNYLLVEIEDNGIGRKAAEEIANKRLGFEKGKSMSMSITAQRLKLLRQSLGTDVQVEISDKLSSDNTPLGTLVRVRLPKVEDDWED